MLHDDCAPDANTLHELLVVATSDDRIAVVGPRIRAWPRAQRLLEVGVSISGTGHRETRLELGEYDQGQHDAQRDGLAVSTAGMLVRREVWNRLGGLDPRLPLFRDDVDFGWRVARVAFVATRGLHGAGLLQGSGGTARRQGVARRRSARALRGPARRA